MVRPIRSWVVGSIQCASSTMNNTGVAGQKNDLPLARRGFAPARRQQSDFTVAPDQAARALAGGGLVAAQGRAFTIYAAYAYRLSDALEDVKTQVSAIKSTAQQALRGVCDHHLSGTGERLQPRGKIRRLAHDSVLRRSCIADQITCHHEARSNAHPNSHRLTTGLPKLLHT